MIAEFWSGIAGEVGKQWAARVLTPALAFWSVGLTVVWYESNRAVIGRLGWIQAVEVSTRKLSDLPPVVTVGILPILAMLLVTASALAANRLTLRVLRLLEGYWRRPYRLRSWLVDRRVSARATAMEAYQRLQLARSRGELSNREELDLEHATAALSFTPARPELTMPTRLGNLLRVAEIRPSRKHGVNAITCWPHLWLTMPADTRTELAAARQALDQSARTWLWSALFVIWTPWAWWAPLAAVAAAAVCYQNCLSAAGTFASLLEAAFDVHLPLLYSAVRIPPPPSPADEVAYGVRLTRYLFDGSADPELRFRLVEEASDETASASG